MKTVTIYTDGACSCNPGLGGWAAVLIYRSVRREISGGCTDTTNNRMEITAALMALRTLKEPCKVELYTDSAYLCNTFRENWIGNWVLNGWKKSDRKPVENSDLWKQMLEFTSVHKVTWHKVKGHAENEFNNRCDELAREEIKKLRRSEEQHSDSETPQEASK